MNILVACECSGLVRDAFRAQGHAAISCDLKPCERPGPHWQCDVREILHHPWDMLIAHPVCRRLANSGVRWLSRPGHDLELIEAIKFFRLFDRAAHIPRRCVENPIMHRYGVKYVGRKATQFVQPWMFGSPYQRATGLWLTGLPRLRPTHRKCDFPHVDPAVWRMGPSPKREERRSATDPAIATAMAKQWGQTNG